MLTVARVILVFSAITGIYNLSPAEAGQLFPPGECGELRQRHGSGLERGKGRSRLRAGAYRHQRCLLNQSGSRQLSKRLQHPECEMPDAPNLRSQPVFNFQQ